MVSGVDWAVLSRPRDNELSGTSRFPASEWAVVFRDQAIDIVVRRTGAYWPPGQCARSLDYTTPRGATCPARTRYHFETVGHEGDVVVSRLEADSIRVGTSRFAHLRAALQRFAGGPDDDNAARASTRRTVMNRFCDALAGGSVSSRR